MYGSVVNRIMESGRPREITPGMGGTVCHWSDRSSVTVVEVRYAKDGKTVTEFTTVGDQVSRNLETWPAQRYEITPGWKVGDPIPERVQTWRIDKDGRIRGTRVNENGRRVLVGRREGPGLSLGGRDYYQDPSF